MLNLSIDDHDFSNHSQFNEYLLTARLKKVSQKNIEKFYKDVVNTNDKPKSKIMLIEEIVAHYRIMLNNSEFKNKFGIFIRDYVLSAKESEHLIEINNKKAFIQWINNWANNTYFGKILAPTVAEVWREQEKSRIAFLYNNNTYSFTVTNSGGLFFKQYAPEEVITYVLLKILLLQNLNNGYSSN